MEEKLLPPGTEMGRYFGVSAGVLESDDNCIYLCERHPSEQYPLPVSSWD